MGKRTITDTEIGLIKGLLSRAMKNSDIQFYFNRPDRHVNSGRITQIKGGTYGPEVPEASSEELDDFLSKQKAQAAVIGDTSAAAVISLSIEDQARALFELRGRTGWFLRTHESDATECKETFCLTPENRFADPLRSIAGLANHRGGFIFFGIKDLPDGSLSVVGLRDDRFSNTDPSAVNRCLAGALDPVPNFSMFVLAFAALQVGVIHVEQHQHPPVMAVKTVNTEVKEGTIYYRYVGETRAIKPGELRQIISYREQKAVAEFVSNMAQVASGKKATLDLDTGKIEGRVGSFSIDEGLLPKIQFIREGEFQEARGAPTLRLIGDVTTVGSSATKTVRGNVTDESVLLNYLKHEQVAEPMQYILHSAHTGRAWLPLFYYANAANRSRESIAIELGAENATQASNRSTAVRRLKGSCSDAFQTAKGRSKAILDALLRGAIELPTEPSKIGPLMLAIQGIPATAAVDRAKLREAVLASYNLIKGCKEHNALRSVVYRAACRLDELEFGDVTVAAKS